ncbi:MAG TPA: carbon-nitrogen hydrolase family protein [Thermomicrobiales bacterium]|nr:carbon-nitrogen hydrolase family protein [Thermomicrobiales bacterium]
MADTLRVGLVQMNSRADKAANLDKAERLIAEAADAGARLVALPEYVTYLGPKDRIDEVAESIPGPTSERFANLARRHGISLLAGSMHERSPYPGKYYNTSTLFDPRGELIAAYRKIHLFDVRIGETVVAAESDRIAPGDDVVTALVDGHRVGLSICYDLRFPELYRALADEGAELLFVPAAFTMFTGKDHWELLLRARAVENQCYVVAPGQIGRYEPEGWCYGRSLVADPWGVVVAVASDEETVALATLDFGLVEKYRTELPSLANRRLAPARRELAAR